MGFLSVAAFAVTSLFCSNKNRRYIWLQLWEAGIFRSYLIQAPFDGWSLFGEILDAPIKEISDLSKLPKSPGRERKKASTSKSIIFLLLFKDPKPHAQSFLFLFFFSCWKEGHSPPVATSHEWGDVRKPEGFVLIAIMLKPFFSGDTTVTKVAFLKHNPNWREKQKTVKTAESGWLPMTLAKVAGFRQSTPNQKRLCFLHTGTDTVSCGSAGINVNASGASSHSPTEDLCFQGRAPSSSFGCQN